MHLLEIQLANIAHAVRAMLGAPDYERYLAHVAREHPGCDPMTRDQFFKERMENRYSKPGTRCC